MTKRRFILLIFVLSAATGLLLFNAKHLPDETAEAPETEVLIQKVTEQNLSISRRFIAEISAINAVNLRPQVSGYLEEVKFAEGSFVNQGDELFIIEQDRYLAELSAAKAALNRAESRRKQQKNNYDRQKKLNKSKFVSAAAFELAESDAKQALADVETAQSQIKLAELNVGYTKIKAPISGYIGKAVVTKGNYVDTTTESLARIVQTNPIRMVLSLTGKDRTLLLDKGMLRKSAAVRLVMPDGKSIPLTVGKMFSDSEVNRTTGTVSLYLDMDNPDALLFPGDFADITVTLDKAAALTIPQTAIAADSEGNYVFVVDAEHKAHKRYVLLGEIAEGKQEVLSGLTKGETIVSEGNIKIEDGQKIRVKN